MTAIVLDICHYKLFKQVMIHRNEKENVSFLPVFFSYKGLDVIHLGNILHHKSIRAMAPPYYKDQTVPII
jgi:hypothetical protein